MHTPTKEQLVELGLDPDTAETVQKVLSLDLSLPLEASIVTSEWEQAMADYWTAAKKLRDAAHNSHGVMVRIFHSAKDDQKKEEAARAMIGLENLMRSFDQVEEDHDDNR